MPQHRLHDLLQQALKQLNLDISTFHGSQITVVSPIDGGILARLRGDNAKSIEANIQQAKKTFVSWRLVPAPLRGEVVRHYGNMLRQHKEALATLVTLESGKIREEARGEVQEMIDICDYAAGLSRSLHGLTLPSERQQHTLQENWHPLGVVGIISAFNFPTAVWAWNAALALVCGNTVVWKPSLKTPLSALASQALLQRAYEALNNPNLPPFVGISDVILGDVDAANHLAKSHDIALVSATGSCKMGYSIGQMVAARLGRSLLELGGNNGVVITPSANLDIAMPSLLFGAVGTAGQRCTTIRRAIVHHSIINDVTEQLKQSYQSMITRHLGNPLDNHILIGPLIGEHSFLQMQQALADASTQGGKISFGKRRHDSDFAGGYYVEPALVNMPKQTAIVTQETFAPILYIMPYHDLEEAVAIHNAVPQGLSSAIFSQDIHEIEYFKHHSDCGIVNVNIGTSGAEIGGAFGGEKETGGGRESGSDSWKAYMRRQTSTTYWGETKPALAQGIHFDPSSPSQGRNP
ncbi:MAG: aldehyde dehydrogenase family protein [Alphaproteobacteria bacterium]|nr:aldehyde dehydrogenase family protein [Alphaproteobacteria bacterium]